MQLNFILGFKFIGWFLSHKKIKYLHKKLRTISVWTSVSHGQQHCCLVLKLESFICYRENKKNEKLNMTSKSLQLSQLHVCTSHKFQPQLTKKLIIFIYYLDDKQLNKQLKIYIPLDQFYNINNKLIVC